MSTIRPPEVRHADKPAGKVALPTIRLAAFLGMLATAALLGVVSAAAGLGAVGWITGLVTGSAAAALLVTVRRRSDQPAMFPADWVTLTRMLLIAGVAGLVADSFGRPVSVTALVTLSTVALVLDAVDGPVARRTGTTTRLGARIDSEADAFLILLLSIAVSQDYGSWVLVIGAARYALLLAGWLIPWLAAPLPPRYWGKVVAAVQGIVLTVAASGLLDRLVGMIAVAAALLLLAESFGRSVIWLYRTGAGPRARRAVRFTIAALALVVLWFAVLAPDRLGQFSFGAFVRIPIELLVLVAAALVLPPWPRRIVAAVAGILFGLLTLDNILNIVFYAELARPFNPALDWGDLAPGIGVVRDAIGTTRTNIALVALWLGLILVIGAITASAIHITTVTARHRRAAVRVLAAPTAVWALCASLSLQLAPGFPVASTSAAGLAVAQVRGIQASLRDQRHFEQALHGPDPEASVPASDLLTGLRGKDVIIAFVESYGQVAVQGTNFSAGVDTVLRRSTASLARAGWSTQSAWINAPGFGGASWFAHSTLQSGLWADTGQRYNQLVGSRRFTLSDAFNKAGWRTVYDAPADNVNWPVGTSYYHFAKIYDRRNVGYHGPTFSYAPMPDQYTLAEFQRLELTPGHKPVMAQIVLVSSHSPWAPLPVMVPWNKVGNGSIFDPMPARGETPLSVVGNASKERQAFGKSIQYTMTALTSWVTELNDPNLVLILLGDEQPGSPITRPGANHDVPISIVTRAPSVLKQISSWRWQNGLLPASNAPLEPLDAFRNQLLNTFNSKTPARDAPAQGSAATRAAAVSGTSGR
ncbi:MAG TPA: CDP-alcohol phosphatidyltransferase family protein [Streptosporangiaceae bacterium]|nr:CDP-alcohol phosphatidyltransferase family protein [Streptosporangiaceae bacterium]